MADQKALKKRLKKLMQLPANQVCSDCPEKRPTWASLIAPPPGSPPGTDKIGSFCCLECSGSHRRLGVHISFVRSINLDSWKELEVRAMENGGNGKVNAIFEARLAESGKKKPSNLADGPTRERYIRDKYERRKFYDPAGYSIDPRQLASQSSPDISKQSGGKPRPGAPSDLARQRVASRQARMKSNTNSNTGTIAFQPSSAKVAKAPVSAPADFDLLDFGAATNALFPISASAIDNDPFSAPATGTSTQTNLFDSAGGQGHVIPPPTPKTAPPLTTASNEDILALFGPTKQQQNQQQSGFGMQAMNNMVPGGVGSGNKNNNMMMMNGMLPQQPISQHGSNMAYINNNQMTPMQQQQMMMMMQNNNMMRNSNQNQMMINQQQMMQQQQQVQNFGHMNNLSGLNNSMTRVVNNNNMSTTLQGMQNITLGNTMSEQPISDDAGFGEPMGGSSQQQNIQNDAFSSLGGMNAFR